MAKKQPEPKPVDILEANTGIVAETVVGDEGARQFAHVTIRRDELSKREWATVKRIITRHVQRSGK